LEIELSIPEADTYFHLAASELSKNLKVDGFRSGKVPSEIVERQLGSQKLYDEAANLAVSKTLPKAIIDNNIEMVGQPDIVITQIARGNPMKYKAKIWVIPEIKIANYKGLEVKKQKLEVKPEEVDGSLKYLQKSRTKLITVNRPAKLGDRVEIDFVTENNGVKIEGGESKGHPLTIGENRFIPGFEQKLEGMKNQEEKKFSLKVPENWHQKNLANKNLDFKVKINLIQERQIPELSDEFAKSLGNFQSLEQLKSSIQEGILKEKKQKDQERIRMELAGKVAENSEMDIPEVLIGMELDKMINELKASVEDMGLDFDIYLQEIKKSPEDFKKEWRKNAEKRVKISLVLREIAKKEKIEVSKEEIEERINNIVRHYPNLKEAEKNIDLPAFKEYTESVIKNEKVFELLEREAKIT
jgi:trigger factor